MLLIAAIIISAAVSIGIFIKNTFFKPETLEYNGHILPVSKNAEKNKLDPEKFYSENGRIYYDSDDVEYGIDVSSHQGEIDWAKVKADGMDFAIIRVGYRGYGEAGTINKDEYFDRNIQGALENGLKVGVYFFSQAITADEAAEEARFVLDAITGYDISYPVIYDWEHIVGVESARTYYYEDFDISSFANAFCHEIINAGYDSTVYFNPTYGYLLYDIDEISQHGFWLAQYSDRPSFYYGFLIWQYTNAGSVDGVGTSVDINISFIDHYR